MCEYSFLKEMFSVLLDAPQPLSPLRGPPAAVVETRMYTNSFVYQAPASFGSKPSLAPVLCQSTLPGTILNQSGWESVNKYLSVLVFSGTILRCVLCSLSEGSSRYSSSLLTDAFLVDISFFLVSSPQPLTMFPGTTSEINYLYTNPWLKACFKGNPS